MRRTQTRVANARTFGAVAARNRMSEGKRVTTTLGTYSMRKDGTIWHKDARNRGWSKLFISGEMFVKAYRGRTFNL